MTKSQRERIQKVDALRDTLKKHRVVEKRQEVGGVVFELDVRVSARDNDRVDADTLHKGCEEMSEYLFYGGMAL